MEILWVVIRFLLGLSIGSFLNVVAFRYEEESGFLNVKKLGGRSHCRVCLKPLSWYELIPLFSFLFQKAKCRSCLTKLSWQYPLLELVTALDLVFLPYLLSGTSLGIWLLASFILIAVSAIDVRLRIIPDEANLLIFILGLVQLLVSYKTSTHTSFFSFYGYPFGLTDPVWLNQLVGFLVGLGVFGLIILLTRGRAMGMGDLKLAAAAGLLMGWPDILIAIMVAFIAGGLYSLPLILARKKGLKDMVPFGPFIVFGIAVVVFFGEPLMAGYFNFFEWLLTKV